MRRDRLGQACCSSRLPADGVDGVPRHVRVFRVTREEPVSWSICLPVVAQEVEQFGREHHEAILPAFTLADADEHSLAIDVNHQ